MFVFLFITFSEICIAQNTISNDGYLTYSTENHPKANGLKITMKYPSDWEKQEALMPHIVQKFSNISGNKSVLIYIAECDLENATASEEDMKAFAKQLDSKWLSDFLPKNAKVTIIDKHTTTVSGLPAILVEYNFSIEESDYSIYCEYITCILFFNDNNVMIMGSVADLTSNTSIARKRMKSLKPVFYKMVNSIVIQNKSENSLAIQSESRNNPDDSSMSGLLLLVGFIMIIVIAVFIYRKTENSDNSGKQANSFNTDKTEQIKNNEQLIIIGKTIIEHCFSVLKLLETKDNNQKRELTILVIVAHRLGIQFSPVEKEKIYEILKQFDSYDYSKSRDVLKLCNQRGEVYFNMLNNHLDEINKNNWRPFYEELSFEFQQFCLGREQNGPVIISGKIFENLLLGGYANKLFAMSFSTTQKILIDYNDKIME